MKKTILILTMGLWGGWLCAQDKTNEGYNPFRHDRDEYIKTGREMYEEFLTRVCDKDLATEMIQEYNKTKSKDILYQIGYMNCDTVVPFLQNLIILDKETRYEALTLLGWRRPYQLLPFLLELSRKEDELFFINRIAITLCVMEQFEVAGSILDKVCFNVDGSVNKDCIIAYEYAGRTDLARKFYLSEWHKENDEDRKFGIALKLVEYGIYDISFSVIKEAIYSNDQNKRHSALYGLAAIATEEALQLIQISVKDSNIVVANTAKSIIETLKQNEIEK
ncbi:MAG: hypothetical protein LBL18_02635 [Bacteroidales bacterium]|jgi:hypothetical protein|nr:hypothetical protein [Bacteroidales bacterium]